MKKSNKIVEKRLSKEWKNIIFDLVFAFLTILATSLFYKTPKIAFVVIGLISVIGLVKWKSRISLLIFIFGGLFGPFAEMVLIHSGAWSYTYPNFFNFPIWLFVVWGNAAVFMYQVALEIHKLGVKK